MKWICVMAGALAMAASAAPSQAAISDCPVPPGAIKVALGSGLPPALRKALPDGIALPGEPFDATDVYVMGHKHRRFIFVWNIGSRWIVAMEQGGIAPRAAIFTYDFGKDSKTATLIDKRIIFPESVCADATKLAEDEIRPGTEKRQSSEEFHIQVDPIATGTRRQHAAFLYSDYPRISIGHLARTHCGICCSFERVRAGCRYSHQADDNFQERF